MNKRLIQSAILGVVVSLFTLASSAVWAAQRNAGRLTKNEFFIVSEVSLQKHQVVMEEPSQMTMTMRVDNKTVFTNGHGKRLPVSALRAGDTVYVTYVRNGKGVTALRIRSGPMTVQELHRSYWNS